MKRFLLQSGLILYFVIFLALVAVFSYFWENYEEAPDQPIAFSHKKHVGDLELECTLCHTTVEIGKHAGAPPVATCMSCHEGVATDRPEIQKLTRYWNEKQPVPWAQVHKVKPHVYFSHKRHIKAGLDCANCHGEVATMDKMRRVSSLKMGWCVDCHTAKGAPKDCYTCHK